MGWQKKGLIYCPSGKNGWDLHTALTPTPFLIDPKTIRIYASFRDNEGQGRIGYIDVRADNPQEIINIGKNPALDLGADGMFDDNGVILGDIVRNGDEVRMYYIGFQLPERCKFMAFSGLAISKDGGDTFERVQQTPIMDRTGNALFIRAIHTAMYDEGTWKVWYSVGNGWEIIDGIPYPQYDIRYTESADGINFEDREGVHCIGNAEHEYRIGRPRVRKLSDGTYEMRYTSDTRDKQYKTGIALSDDGIHWTRRDELTDIGPSETGWDSEMLCYPVILEAAGKTYMFYSGNGMGATGMGYAEKTEGSKL